MRSKFAWALITEKETDEVWKNAIVTVDANVLLDLYRLETNACGALLVELKRFAGRIWISDMASREFFRSRESVINGVTTTYETARAELKGIRTAIEKLKSHRVIDSEVIDDLKNAFVDGMRIADEKIDQAKDRRPDYLRDDPILTELLELFDGATGEVFPPEEHSKLINDAAARKKAGIPPGLTDDVITGDLAYGDFFVWKQILRHASQQKKPIIFITSEKKADWFSGKKGGLEGPKQELLREAWEETGQRVLILQTDNFLQQSQVRNEVQVNELAVQEIRNVNTDDNEESGIVYLGMEQYEIKIRELTARKNGMEINLAVMRHILTTFQNEFETPDILQQISDIQTAITNTIMEGFAIDAEVGLYRKLPPLSSN